MQKKMLQMKVKKRKDFADKVKLILSFLYCYNTINPNK